MQSVQEVAPIEAMYFPGWQLRQSERRVAPGVARYFDEQSNKLEEEFLRQSRKYLKFSHLSNPAVLAGCLAGIFVEFSGLAGEAVGEG